MVGLGKRPAEVWVQIGPLLLVSRRGEQWRNYRQVLNEILRKLRTEAPWRNLSKRYGPYADDGYPPLPAARSR